MNTSQRFQVASPRFATLGPSNRFIGILVLAFLLTLIALPCESIYGQGRGRADLGMEPVDQSPKAGPEAPASDTIQRMRTISMQEQHIAELMRRIAELQTHVAQYADMADRYSAMGEQVVRDHTQSFPSLFGKDLLKDAKLDVLRTADSERLAQILQELIGPHKIRVAPDKERSRLFLYAEEDVLERVAEVMENLDLPGKPHPEAAVRPLMVRIFWLADGLPEDEGQELTRYLPNSLQTAVSRLGLENPRIISQGTSSLALGGDRGDASFELQHLQAIAHGAPLDFSCRGELSLSSENRVRLEMEVEVISIPHGVSGLHGSLTAPLGHYMVLGTASTLVDKEPARYAFVVQVIEAESYQSEGQSQTQDAASMRSKTGYGIGPVPTPTRR